MADFEPTIVAFCCHYCAYGAADLAGSMRLEYPTNIRVIRLPCTGKITPVFLLRAFEKGADGVYVAGCLEGDCHFIQGNLVAKPTRELYEKIDSGSRSGAGTPGDVQYERRHGPEIRRSRS